MPVGGVRGFDLEIFNQELDFFKFDYFFIEIASPSAVWRTPRNDIIRHRFVIASETKQSRTSSYSNLQNFIQGFGITRRVLRCISKGM